MKRSELEKHLGKNVKVRLFDGEILEGELHKTREKQFENEPNLFIPTNRYFLTPSVKCLFRCTHVVSLKGGGE